MLLTTLILGLVLGGTYALLALGLTLQYGISRIMNLAYGELTLIAATGEEPYVLIPQLTWGFRWTPRRD